MTEQKADFLAALVFIIIFLYASCAFCDTNDDFGWAGDVGCVTGLTFELSNGPDHRGNPDPLAGEISMILFDYGGQRLLRGEPFLPDAAHPIGPIEGEQIATAFALNQMIVLPLECLLHMR